VRLSVLDKTEPFECVENVLELGDGGDEFAA
jgi:hypothetical protein